MATNNNNVNNVRWTCVCIFSIVGGIIIITSRECTTQLVRIANTFDVHSHNLWWPINPAAVYYALFCGLGVAGWLCVRLQRFRKFRRIWIKLRCSWQFCAARFVGGSEMCGNWILRSSAHHTRTSGEPKLCGCEPNVFRFVRLRWHQYDLFGCRTCAHELNTQTHRQIFAHRVCVNVWLLKY